jgi:Tol biopolymer transport system component
MTRAVGPAGIACLTTALTAPDRIACSVDWSPDGRFLIHLRGREGSSDLWVMDLEGHAIPVTHTPGTYVAVWWLK